MHPFLNIQYLLSKLFWNPHLNLHFKFQQRIGNNDEQKSVYVWQEEIRQRKRKAQLNDIWNKVATEVQYKNTGWFKYKPNHKTWHL